MQTKITIEIDSEILDKARVLADSQGTSVESLITSMLERDFTRDDRPIRYDSKGLGIRLLPSSKDDPIITMELVNELRDGTE